MTASNSSSDSDKAGVSHDEENDSPSSSSETSSGSTEGTSPSTTPPSQEAQPVVNPTLGPRTHHDASYSATPPRRNKKHIPPHRNTARLGAIDEHSNSIAPDIPTRNPARKYYRYGSATKFFTFAAYTRSDPTLPPVGAYDNITGPRGEKFGDLRQNRPFRPPNRGGWRRALCLGSVALVILLAIGLGVGLGLGLTRNKATSDENPTQPTSSDPDNDDPAPFPLGIWSVPTYLATTGTNCTSNPSTWRCYPYTTYSSTSPTSSYSTLTWRITSPTNSTTDLRISNSNTIFSYPFAEVPLQVIDTNDPRLSAYSFEFVYRKQVVPDADITGDGAATRCYYNDTTLSVKLYNTVQGAGGDIREDNSTALTSGHMDWPFAIEYEETNSGAAQCFRYVDGKETEEVSVDAGFGDCVCGYRNYGLG